VQLTGAEVATQTKRLAPKYDDMVIDVGGRDTTSQRAALAVADILLIPFPPRSVDLWTSDKVTQLIDEARPFNAGLRVCAVINKGFSRGKDNEEAAEMLREQAEHWRYLDTPVGDRKAFSNAFGNGLAVTEYIPRDAKAVAEIKALHRALSSIS
jgi:chromosome partitioning protein